MSHSVQLYSFFICASIWTGSFMTIVFQFQSISQHQGNDMIPYANIIALYVFFESICSVKSQFCKRENYELKCNFMTVTLRVFSSLTFSIYESSVNDLSALASHSSEKWIFPVQFARQHLSLSASHFEHQHLNCLIWIRTLH